MTDEESIEAIINVLQSLNEFDVDYIAKVMGCYLLFFSLGYIAGTVIKLMKRA